MYLYQLITRIASTDTNNGQKLGILCSFLLARRAGKQNQHNDDFFWLTASMTEPRFQSQQQNSGAA